MDTVQEVNSRKWIALYAFLVLDFFQIIFISILYINDLNPFMVELNFGNLNPASSFTLMVIIGLLQLILVYLSAISMQRSTDLLKLYPDYREQQEWACRYSREEIVKWTLDIAKTSGVDVHRIYLMRSPIPNAFTFSLPFMGSMVAVHSNILDVLEVEEVKAIIAHEVGHIKNRDSMVQILARMPSFFIDTIYLYIYLRLGLGIANAALINEDLFMAGVRVLVLGGFFILSRFVSLISNYLMQKASREAELLSDYHAAEVIGATETINGLIRLGQRSEAISVLIGEIRWLESLNPERTGAVPQKELIRMIEHYPLDGIDENNAREMAPWVFLSTKMKHLRDVYGVALTDQQISDAVEPAMIHIQDKHPKKDKSTEKSKIIDWRAVDYDGDRRLSNDEIKDLLDLLRKNPSKLMFDSEVGMNFLAVSHPDFRRRVLTIADAFNI